MKNIYFPVILSVFILTTASCGKNVNVKNAYLRREARRVRVIKEYPKNCEPAGSIIGRSTYKASGKVVWRYAMNDLRNKAASKGIYTVVLDNHKHSTEGSYLTIRLYGKLLDCSEDKKSGVRKGGLDSAGSDAPPRPKSKMARPKTTTPDTNYEEDSPPEDADYESEENANDEEENDNPPPNPDVPDF